MGLGYNALWVKSYRWPQQTWGQRSSRGQWPLVQVFADTVSNLILQWLQKYVIAKAGETCGSRTALSLISSKRNHNSAVKFGMSYEKNIKHSCDTKLYKSLKQVEKSDWCPLIKDFGVCKSEMFAGFKSHVPLALPVCRLFFWNLVTVSFYLVAFCKLSWCLIK